MNKTKEKCTGCGVRTHNIYRVRGKVWCRDCHERNVRQGTAVHEPQKVKVY